LSIKKHTLFACPEEPSEALGKAWKGLEGAIKNGAFLKPLAHPATSEIVASLA